MSKSGSMHKKRVVGTRLGITIWDNKGGEMVGTPSSDNSSSIPTLKIRKQKWKAKTNSRLPHLLHLLLTCWALSTSLIVN